MPPRLSAIDAVSPALAQTKRQLFQPFRFGLWARLGVVAMLAREFTGGGFGGGNFRLPQSEGRKPEQLFFLVEPVWERLEPLLPVILIGLAALLLVLLFWVYAGCVFRFILLEAVLTGRCQLSDGWRRWQPQGGSFFLWWIGSSLALVAGLAVLIGAPVYLAHRAGIFRESDQHFGLLLGGGVAVFLLMMGLILVAALVDIFARDFVVPVMAVENLGVLDAWRTLLPMLGAEKMAYAGYVLMKAVFTIASAILLGIANLVVFLALLIPLAVVGIVLFVAGKALGFFWNPYTIGAAILLGMALLTGMLYAASVVSAPAMVFFQSYALQFFGSRFPALGARLWPPAPPAAELAPS